SPQQHGAWLCIVALYCGSVLWLCIAGSVLLIDLALFWLSVD
ncbi:MAG: hypothetical protein ACI8X5_000728, partial [Planctomycetota bacterium]